MISSRYSVAQWNWCAKPNVIVHFSTYPTWEGYRPSDRTTYRRDRESLDAENLDLHWDLWTRHRRIALADISGCLCESGTPYHRMQPQSCCIWLWAVSAICSVALFQWRPEGKAREGGQGHKPLPEIGRA